MARQKPAKREWQRKMIDEYYDHRFRETVEPLYQDMQRWKAGKIAHAKLDRSIHETHTKMQKLWSLFNESRDFLVGLIRMDEDWFAAWLKENPTPPQYTGEPNV